MFGNGERDENAALSEERKVVNNISKEDVQAFRECPELNMYQIVATRSAIYPGQGTPFGLMYAALGLAEAGEVQNKAKKAFRDDNVLTIIENDGGHAMVEFLPLTPQRRDQLIKELGGVLWYVAAVCNELDVDMNYVALANLEELCGRSERGTLGGDGDDR
jgi:NTP pyrophosphatase (non-canonical NTP hydrolase)